MKILDGIFKTSNLHQFSSCEFKCVFGCHFKYSLQTKSLCKKLLFLKFVTVKIVKILIPE